MKPHHAVALSKSDDDPKIYTLAVLTAIPLRFPCAHTHQHGPRKPPQQQPRSPQPSRRQPLRTYALTRISPPRARLPTGPHLRKIPAVHDHAALCIAYGRTPNIANGLTFRDQLKIPLETPNDFRMGDTLLPPLHHPCCAPHPLSCQTILHHDLNILSTEKQHVVRAQPREATERMCSRHSRTNRMILDHNKRQYLCRTVFSIS